MSNLSVKLASSFALVVATFSLTPMAEKVNAATMVDLELGLLIDASDSIDKDEFDLQIDAYQSIFTDENFYRDFIGKGEKKKLPSVPLFLVVMSDKRSVGL